jgi:gamma-glutamyl hercynylcysteine S-oxide synthase
LNLNFPATDADFRHATGPALAAALQASRRDTLATFAAYEAALGTAGMVVPQRADLNPPLWELGHIGWFQEWWLARNPAAERARGAAANPLALRAPAARANADALYDSGRVAQATRWQLPLPEAQHTRQDLALQLQNTLALLEASGSDDAALYFFRLVLAHEDMHHEAALYMAQALSIPIADARWQPQALPEPAAPLRLAAGEVLLGGHGAIALPAKGKKGFVFDNELGAHRVALPAFEIDTQVLRWQDYLPMVQARVAAVPRYLRRATGTSASTASPASGTGWEVERYGRWQPLNLAQPVCHVNAHEAQAWCDWAGRRLPTESEWQRAATEHPEHFAWGAVWEWTASNFEAYPGFQPHPYLDYSAPWFGGTHRVLRGACFASQPRMRSLHYRNFFTPGRNDVFAGFRTCAR